MFVMPPVDMFVMPPVDMFVMPPVDFGPTCIPRCETTVAVTCPGGVESRVDCAPMPARCDATGATPTCIPLACFPSSTACTTDTISVDACNAAGTGTTTTHCDRGCDPGTSDCRPALGCGSFSTDGMITTGTMRFDLCGAGDDNTAATTTACTVASDGEDVIVRLEVDHMARYTLSLVDVGGGYRVDPVISVRNVCDDRTTQLGCDDDGGSSVDSLLVIDLPPGEYFLIVDSVDTQSGGTGCGNVDLTVTHT